MVKVARAGAGCAAAVPVNAPANRRKAPAWIEWMQAMTQHSTTNSTSSADRTAGYLAARQRLGLIDRRDRGRILVSGHDRGSYLQGLLTNDVAGLKAGQGCYAAYLTAQGRMIADLHVYELGDVMLLTVPIAARDTVLAKLDQFVFSEDVQLGDVTDTFASLGLVGPLAARTLASIAGAIEEKTLAALPANGNVRATFAGEPVIVLSMDDAGVPGFEVLVSTSQRAAFENCCRAEGAEDVPAETAEALRIEAGIPLFHRDMDEDTIPLEAGIESRAISLTKGCYVGQEVIIRVLHRGHGRVARRLVGLVFDTDRAAAAGAAVTSGDREIGHVTSATVSPGLGRAVALAYVHRDFTAPGTAVAVGEMPATVSALPFLA
jgi:folate-binding protein YgfZ